MKILLLLSVVGWFSSPVSTESMTITDAHLTKEFAAETFANFLLTRIVDKRREQLTADPGNGARIPIIVLPPVITFPFENYTLNLDNQLAQGFYEHGATSLVISGASDDLVVDLNGTAISLSYVLTTAEIALRGTYNTNIILNGTLIGEDFPPEYPILGNGGYEFALNEFGIHLTAALHLVGGAVDTVATTFSFTLGGVNIHFQNLSAGGEDVEQYWEFINMLLNGAIPALLPELSTAVEGVIAPLLSQLEGCKLQEIIGQDLTCLGIPPGPTTTTQRPTPPGKINGSPQMTSSGILFITVLAVAAFVLRA